MHGAVFTSEAKCELIRATKELDVWRIQPHAM